jgi:hypothetical protein
VHGEETAHWERLLEADGLGVASKRNALPSKFRAMTAVELEAHVDAVETWQTWAYRVLRDHRWRDGRHREIWRLYAQGMSTRKLSAVVARIATRPQLHDSETKRFSSGGCPGSRSKIMALIARVSAEYPGPPNPWTGRAECRSTEGELSARPSTNKLRRRRETDAV